MTEYRFISDPGHGWLEVPIKEINRLGIADKISGYSYRNKDMAYLEEDCDMGEFILAKANANEGYVIKEEYQENMSIRGYRHFHQ